MSALVENSPELPMTESDYFRALEERVLRTVELLKTEREKRAAAETSAARLDQEIKGLKEERDAVRQRIERLLAQLDQA
jgi:hypothetical protein